MPITLDDTDPDASLLVRTDFSDDDAWDALLERATAPYGPHGFCACFVAVSDPAFNGFGSHEVAAAEGSAPVVFVADSAAMAGAELSLLAVDRVGEPGRSFRVLLPNAWAPENNLRLANMEFAEFVDAVDPDGVFRGFTG